MITAGLLGCDFVVANTDAQALTLSKAERIIQMGTAATPRINHSVGVNVRKVDPGTFYGDNYLKWGFAQDFWFTRTYLGQVAQGSLPDSPYNETHWADP